MSRKSLTVTVADLVVVLENLGPPACTGCTVTVMTWMMIPAPRSLPGPGCGGLRLRRGPRARRLPAGAAGAPPQGLVDPPTAGAAAILTARVTVTAATGLCPGVGLGVADQAESRDLARRAADAWTQSSPGILRLPRQSFGLEAGSLRSYRLGQPVRVGHGHAGVAARRVARTTVGASDRYAHLCNPGEDGPSSRNHTGIAGGGPLGSSSGGVWTALSARVGR